MYDNVVWKTAGDLGFDVDVMHAESQNHEKLKHNSQKI